MKKISVVFGILMLSVWAVAAVKAETTSSQEIGISAEVSKPADAGNKICPVMGGKINEKTKLTYEYKGKIYNFCCAMCIDEFKKAPEKYIEKVNKELEIQSKAEDTANQTVNMHEGHQH